MITENTYIVYRHRNKINNKVYIGITCKKLHIRSGFNGERYDKCPRFWKAIQKYGWDNFEHDILFSGLTREEACKKEIQMIRSFHATEREYGYNISRGGGLNDGLSTAEKWEDQAYREEMCMKMREAWKDPEKRKKRSEAAKARWKNEEFKQRAVKSVTDACKRAVECIETRERFDVLKLAARAYGVCSANISRSCKIGYACGGFHWRYVDNGVP